jgi:hypothetical protein
VPDPVAEVATTAASRTRKSSVPDLSAKKASVARARVTVPPTTAPNPVAAETPVPAESQSSPPTGDTPSDGPVAVGAPAVQTVESDNG